ncbi:L-fucose/L-arabinose isomerase family protein [Zymomonas mobilis]|uniref:L-fucose isomerase-like protein n=1 Tax=Zymomonas mobilis subsp. mobilis (strain ATCC 31821 / ZM4 / CP4) TaxID=264203 RepID=A0A806CJR4_ZYMMO|nr:L-fucose/L-arabinose isomerase family protein [Zymomonas mobilis]ADC33832.1 L-fucose isomerase-like protein [Zymomonas mobilis subsp. mobilis ZM4 = ATCC 31821]AHB11087.1 L-fucose isomerase family protein [Zymomonas mobilis subsp. mobilis str. CP4 = NRRL B-14023]AHJ71363.1 L-fucose isomerase related protein [Zymomonas mobilis subsp. mobilis NRRL B-12526]AHJ73207.1 L-fucose isomerase-related protein [Zymomonas mobilis subsp. mobilis str. CP4 = NRRL B-14023]
MENIINKPRVGVLALGRETFDIPYAKEILKQVCASLHSLDIDIIGDPVNLCCDKETTLKTADFLKKQDVDLLLILQITFTDASLTMDTVKTLACPTLMWSFPEPRTGGRLRLNSFCGVNLANHALSRESIKIQTIHGLPDNKNSIDQLLEVAKAAAIIKALKKMKIMVIGDHPTGFDACNYNPLLLKQYFGVQIDCEPLPDFINEVKELPDSIADAAYDRRAKDFSNLSEMDQTATRKTLKVYSGLKEKAKMQAYNGIAVRCWPDFFIDYGCAACGALALMNEDKIPCGCEADVLGVLSSLLAQQVSGDVAFNTDLVDVDSIGNTVVFWHCGQAPIQMADRDGILQATVHSNRKLPLLSEFALKPGRITLVRITQGEGKLRLMIGGGEMLKAPLPFSGTAGTARLDIDAQSYRERLISIGLEHHTTLFYGEHRPLLKKIGQLIGLETIDLTA